MRLFIHNKTVINIDNEQDAERLSTDPATERELTPEEITQIFGNRAHLAGPDNTAIDGAGNIVFTLPPEYVELSTWVAAFVRPERDVRLSATDKYMIPDFPIDQATRDQIEAYRQKLRDFPATLSMIVDPIPWPDEPKDTTDAD